MGILQDQLQNSVHGLKGATPGKRAGASPTSQLHAYGNFEKEAQDFQNAQVFPNEYRDLTNVGYKLKGEASQLDLDGQKPSTYTDYISGLTEK